MSGVGQADPEGFGSGPRRAAIVAVLATAQGLGIAPLVAIGVLAPFLIDDFEISRAGVGLLVALVSGVSAVLSPAAGNLADAMEDRRALLWVLVLGTISLLWMAAAPTYVILIGALTLAGIARAGCNPATNRVISLRVPPGQRGWITGLKQSGETIAVMLAGSMLPALALLWGWRVSILSLALIAIVALIAGWILVQRSEGDEASRAERKTGRLRPSIGWLNGYNLAMGAGGGAVTAYLPLYAHEEGHLSVAAAGGVIVLAGIVGGAGRLLWSRWSETTLGFPVALSGLAALAVGSGVVLLAAPNIGATAFWAGAALWGISGLAFGPVAMLAVMAESDHTNTGKASGMNVLFFGLGFTLTPPLFGWLVDHTGDYGVGFALITAIYAIAAIQILLGRDTFRPLVRPESA
jgi:predicted MFS family arabinose efflux permease